MTYIGLLSLTLGEGRLLSKWLGHVGRIVIAMALLCCVTGAAAEAQSVLRDGDRIVVVGDSITGQSLGGNGYVALIQEALRHANAATKTTVTPLGGSGHTVGSWIGVEKDSRLRNFNLDVPNVDVKKTLDEGADVIIVMLGMNNVLRPDMGNTPDDVARWTANYQTLISALRERTHPRVLALAAPTFCTEDETGSKNVMLDKLAEALNGLATNNDCVILPVRDAFRKMQREGRTYRPDFHATNDFVHPSPAGHLAIAMGMLDGLGEQSAAKWLYEDRSPAIWKTAAGKLPALSYTLTPGAIAEDVNGNPTFKVAYWFTDSLPRRTGGAVPHVQLTAPKGWTTTPASLDAASGEFVVSGPLDHLQTVLALTAERDKTTAKAEVTIPAPWIVGIGNCGRTGWDNNTKQWVFDAAKGVLPADAQLIHGAGFDRPVVDAPGAKWGRPIQWKRYLASINYPGGASPGSVDLSAVDWFGTFDVAYGVRWIYSPTDRAITAGFDSHTFAGDYFLSLWLNGENVRASRERKGTTDLNLKTGWNALVFRSDHLEWQWQFNIDLAAKPGGTLEDLRFATTPPKPTPAQ